MERRTHESPMDFEWQTHAAGDPSSPFHQLSVTHRKKHGEVHAKKRPYGIFDSPIKTTVPALKEPGSETFLFSSTPAAKTLHSNFRAPSFVTPRTKLEVDIPSSGPDVASSPDNADSEATPEQQSSNAVTPFLPPRSSAKPPLFAQYAARIYSPGRGEVRRGKYSDAITRKVQKRRMNAITPNNRLVMRQQDPYDSEPDHPRQRLAQTQSSQAVDPTQSGVIYTLLHTLETHPHLPHILSYYIQFLLNLFLATSFIWLLYSFWSTIRSDVDLASSEATSAALADIAACATQYTANRCDSAASRVPAMEAVCDNWNRCMNRDPNKVGRARVSAHTFAEIFNAVVEPISYKAMVFVVVIVGTVVVGSNLAFGMVRSKVLGGLGHGQSQQDGFSRPHQTPLDGWEHPRQYGGQGEWQGQPHTPYTTPAAHRMMDPIASAGSGVGTPWGARGGMEGTRMGDGSPTRRKISYH